jgi:hypothetical protein
MCAVTFEYRVLLCRFVPSQPIAQIDNGGAVDIGGAGGGFAALLGAGGAPAHKYLVGDEGERCVVVECTGCLASGVTD